MVKFAVFVSGGGTNLQSIIDAVNVGDLKAKIEVVIASKKGIFAIERAKNHQIPVAVYDRNSYQNLDIMYADMLDYLKELNIDFIVLAGYLSILSENIIKAFKGRIVNIHPSLLPKFGGKGFYGIRVHKAVIDEGDVVSGATVHYVDEGTDTGDIIEQIEVPVYPYDTPEMLQARILEKEHILYPKALNRIFVEYKKR